MIRGMNRGLDCGQTDRYTDRWMGRQRERQTDIQKDRQSELSYKVLILKGYKQWVVTEIKVEHHSTQLMWMGTESVIYNINSDIKLYLKTSFPHCLCTHYLPYFTEIMRVS